MADLIAKDSIAVIIGMGVTGRSVARFFRSTRRPFVWLDTRDEPPGLAEVMAEFPDLNCELGDLKVETLLGAGEIIVSPGVPLQTPAIQAAKNAGVTVLGDIELFLREKQAPVVAITGSNGKSTVTALVGAMAEASGKRVSVGGNIGTPVLDLLQTGECDLYVLELSSFQLETVHNLQAGVATVLNVSEDHMDRYDSLQQYYLSKQRIYFGAEQVVVNRQHPLTAPPLAEGVTQYSFGLDAPDRNGFGIVTKDGDEYIAFEFNPLLPTDCLRMAGRHNLANGLAALALGHAAGLDMDAMLSAPQKFPGLPHRCQWVANLDGVDFYNDSKGTNVGATLSAINGLSNANRKVVLIAGGVGKGADFTPLNQAAPHLRGVVLMGRDAAQIGEQLNLNVTVEFSASLEEALQLSRQLANKGDVVLLSPACASFDMFTGFEDRGNQFMDLVEGCLNEQ